MGSNCQAEYGTAERSRYQGMYVRMMEIAFLVVQRTSCCAPQCKVVWGASGRGSLSGRQVHAAQLHLFVAACSVSVVSGKLAFIWRDGVGLAAVALC